MLSIFLESEGWEP